MIRLEKVKKVFRSGRNEITALKEINLSVSQGEIFGIIGYSGAGKSTLIRLINMLETPSSGEIWVDDQRMDQLGKDRLRRARQDIGMIFQHFNLLWSRTVRENIAFPLEIAGVPKGEMKERVDELVKLVGLEDRADAYPSELSGGQKQRVGIARALANKPKLLLSDEATSALDPKTTDSILNLLKEINRKMGITIILITHEMHVIQKICDRVAIIDHGEIVEEGPVLEVFTHPKLQITKEFVKQVSTHSNTEMDEIISKKFDQNKGFILKCTFVGESANQPIISKWIKTLDIDVNIIEGNIQSVQGSPYGSLYIEVDATQEKLQESINFLRNNDVEVEVVQDVTR